MSDARRLSTTEYTVLAIICEQPAHGWSLVRALVEDGEVGQVWTVRRALVYRTIDQLTARELVATAGTEMGGRGPRRTIVRATPSGRRAARAWLRQPVAHVRDLRSELLLKLILGARAGIDQTAMLERQQQVLAQLEQSLKTRHRTAQGSDRVLLGFRLETTRAAGRFVETVLAEGRDPAR